jgi:hypothetical protein
VFQISQWYATDIRISKCFTCFKLIFQCQVIPVYNLKHSSLLLSHPLNSKALCKHVNLQILPICCKNIIPFGHTYICIPSIYFLLWEILNATLTYLNVTFTHSCDRLQENHISFCAPMFSYLPKILHFWLVCYTLFLYVVILHTCVVFLISVIILSTSGEKSICNSAEMSSFFLMMK